MQNFFFHLNKTLRTSAITERFRITNTFDIRLQVMAVVVFSQLLLLALTTRYLYQSDTFDLLHRPTLLATAASIWMWFLALLLIARLGLSLRLCTHLVIIGSYFTVCFLSVAGRKDFVGIELCLIAIPVFSVCLCGLRCGLVWSAIVLISPILFHQNATGPDSNVASYDISIEVWAAVLLATMLVLSVYEYLNGQQKRQLYQQREHYWYQSTHDSLTGLANRALFDTRLTQTFSNAKHNRSQFGLLFLDINLFKQINDQYGHVLGDKILRNAAERIGACLQKNHFAARVGGDEFAIIIENSMSMFEVISLKNKLHNAFNAPYHGDGVTIHIGISIGCAHYPDHANSTEQLLHAADADMYQHKRAVTGFNHIDSFHG